MRGRWAGTKRSRRRPVRPAVAAAVAALLAGLTTTATANADPPAAGDSNDVVTIPDRAEGSPQAGWRFVGEYTSLVLDAEGNPVVSYRAHGHDGPELRILHCNDPNCAGRDDSITRPDRADAGAETSLALDADGHPVVSYLDERAGRLTVMHCNDPDCAGGDESIARPVLGKGDDTALALDPEGNPVVAYGSHRRGVVVLHCNDPGCTGGDESISRPGRGGLAYSVDLAMDADGHPVVSYHLSQGPLSADPLKILRCDDPDCSGGGETTGTPATTDVGWDTSLVLDAADRPVVTFYSTVERGLGLIHCNDRACLRGPGGPEIVRVPDPERGVGMYSSLALDADGNPVISYHNPPRFDRDLKVAHCNDPDCDPAVGGPGSITSPDRHGYTGSFTSLALDAEGNPVVAYHNYEKGFLKLLHCDDPDCSPLPDTTPPTVRSSTWPEQPDGDRGWFVTPPYLRLGASDQRGTGVVELRCVVDPPVPPDTFAALPQGNRCRHHELSTDGVRDTYAAAIDRAGNAGTPVRVRMKVDTTEPVVRCQQPPEFRVGEPDAAVRARVRDVTSGPVRQRVSAPADTSAPGDFVVPITGRDRAGNRTVVECAYSVG